MYGKLQLGVAFRSPTSCTLCSILRQGLPYNTVSAATYESDFLDVYQSVGRYMATRQEAEE